MDNVTANMVLNSRNNSVSNVVNKKVAKAVVSNQNTLISWVNHVKPQGLGLNIRENMVLKAIEFLTNEVVKPTHIVGKISFLRGIGLTNQEILESIHRVYSGNENFSLQKSSLSPFYSRCILSDTSGSILSIEFQNSFIRFSWKLTFLTAVKYIKKWFFRQRKSHLKKYLDAFETKIQKFIADKRNGSTFSNGPTDCTNEFIYICSESKSINSLLLNKSQFLAVPASSNIPQ